MGPNMKSISDMVRGWWQNRRLVGKHATVMLLATLAIVPFIYLALNLLLTPTFERIEQQAVTDQMARAKNSMAAFESGLMKGVGDYAIWDSSYNYLDAPTAAFEKETLGPITLNAMGVDVIGYVRFDGTPVYTLAADLKSTKEIPAESAQFRKLITGGDFFVAAKAKQQHLAYVTTSRGLYAVTSQWITKSDGSGAAHGFIVMANLLNAASLSEALQSKVGLDLNKNSGIAKAVQKDADHSMIVKSASAVSSYIGLQGQKGELLGIINFQTPRNITRVGSDAIMLATLSMVAAILALVAILGMGIRAITVRRIQKLERYVKNFRTGNAAPQMSDDDGADEISLLSREFQTMAAELEDAEEKLMQKTYLQGKADSAAGMLHNVRNALAPVRVMQEKWLREDSLPYRLNMEKAAAELEQDGIEGARKVQLESFMVTAAKSITLTAASRRAEMEDNKGSIDQIASILGSYDFDTTGKSVGDRIDVLDVLKKEIKALDAREGANVSFDLPENIPAISGNAIHLGQVIGNLLVNADEAMIAADVPEKRIAVSFAESQTPDSIDIRFRDNGDGIAPDKLTSIFQRGYSTREHKAGGLGMHWSANAMRAMGGVVTVESEGMGKGATAILTMQLFSDAQDAGVVEVKAKAA
jgi:signal transduction histidine kinase